MTQRYYPTRLDTSTPERLERSLRLAFDHLYALDIRTTAIVSEAARDNMALAERLSAPHITDALSATGTAPLNVEGLLGVLAQPQKAGAVSVSALPDVLLSQDGELVFYDQQLYRFDGTTEPGSWEAITVRITPLEDSATNSVSTVFTLEHTSTGTVAAGFGAGLLYKLEDAGGNAAQSAGSLDILWTVATAAGDAETADFTVRLKSAGSTAISERFRVSDLGVASLTGLDGITAAITSNLTLKHATSGTAAIGFGSGVLVQLEDAGGNPVEDAGQFGVVWSDPNAGSEDADFVVLLKTAGAAIAEKFRIDSTGNALIISAVVANRAGDNDLILATKAAATGSIVFVDRNGAGRASISGATGDYYWYSGTAFLGQLAHANTGNHVYTFQDADDVVVMRDTTDTLTNKTLTTPTIGDLTNAQHNHSNAAGGGTLNATSGNFTTTDGKTVTVTNGLVTSIV